jgi:hypothetical protein
MKLISYRDEEKRQVHHHLTLEAGEASTLSLSQFDLACLRECDASDSIADKLLAIELIARRVEQRQSKRSLDCARDDNKEDASRSKASTEEIAKSPDR